MRAVAASLLLLAACAGSDPRQSDVAQKLSGAWRNDIGARIIFDIEQDRVLMNNVEVDLAVGRVEGQTVYFTGKQPVTVRLIGDNIAEWDTDLIEPIMLTRIE